FDQYAVKESVFQYARVPGVDTVVICLDRSFGAAFAKSQIGGGSKVPTKGTVFISVKEADKDKIVEPAAKLAGMGFRLIATSGTARTLKEAGLEVATINKVLEGRPHIVDALKNGEVDLVFNTTEGAQALADSKSIRQTALMSKVPYYTTVAGARAAVEGIEAIRSGHMEVASLQSYQTGSAAAAE
ncbi:MAG: carbamoyl phosphate synthase large subunit, partial [Kangiella sp.]|nr:carbamoyl phosphate synthase large subunit [Kangiella sp.]